MVCGACQGLRLLHRYHNGIPPGSTGCEVEDPPTNGQRPLSVVGNSYHQADKRKETTEKQGLSVQTGWEKHSESGKKMCKRGEEQKKTR